jgi:iron-sulfur cluster assembly accessory protein
VIDLTPRAEEQFRKMLDEHPGFKYVRLGVLGGGCSGFEWQLALIDEYKPDWASYEFKTVTIYVDPISLMYADGTTIDYTENFMESGFVFKNAAIKTTCGCGKSFSV